MLPSLRDVLVLGGRYGGRDDTRGVPDIGYTLDRITDQISCDAEGVLLNCGEWIDLATGTVSGAYARKDKSEEKAYLARIRDLPYRHDDDPLPDQDQIAEVIQPAFARFGNKAQEIGYALKTNIAVSGGGDIQFRFRPDLPPESVSDDTLPTLEPYVRITADPRLLKRLLTGPRLAHRNSGETGSHLTNERKPDTFERGLCHALYFLNV